MQPFKQTESGYTATARNIVLSANNTYDVAKLDNPVRKKLNAAVIASNVRGYPLLKGVL